MCIFTPFHLSHIQSAMARFPHSKWISFQHHAQGTLSTDHFSTTIVDKFSTPCTALQFDPAFPQKLWTSFQHLPQSRLSGWQVINNSGA
jgi:hypothetical protein